MTTPLSRAPRRWSPSFGALAALGFAALGSLAMATYFLCIHDHALREVMETAGLPEAGVGAVPGQGATTYVLLGLLAFVVALLAWRGRAFPRWWVHHGRPFVWPLVFVGLGAGFALSLVWVVSAQRAQAQSIQVLQEFALLQSQLNLPTGKEDAWYDKDGQLRPAQQEAWCSQAALPIDFYVKSMSLPSREGRGLGVVLAQGMLNRLYDNGCLDDRGYLERLERLTTSLSKGSGMSDRVLADMAPLPWFGPLAHREDRIRERTLVTPAALCKRVMGQYGNLTGERYVALSRVCMGQADNRAVTLKDAEAIREELQAISPATEPSPVVEGKSKPEKPVKPSSVSKR